MWSNLAIGIGENNQNKRGWEPLYFQIQIQWLVRPLNNREFIVMFMILVWDDFWFVAWWKQAYKFGKLWPWWDAYGQQQYATRLWLSSNDLLVLMGLKCVKTFLTPLHHRYQPELFIHGKFNPWIHAFNFEIHQTRLCFSSLSCCTEWLYELHNLSVSSH